MLYQTHKNFWRIIMIGSLIAVHCDKTPSSKMEKKTQ